MLRSREEDRSASYSFSRSTNALLTSDGTMYDGTIFELNRDRLVVELHQESRG
jgi:hypothetical protein